MTTQPRTPAGSPDGGQFTATAGAESATVLSAPPAPAASTVTPTNPDGSPTTLDDNAMYVVTVLDGADRISDTGVTGAQARNAIANAPHLGLVIESVIRDSVNMTTEQVRDAFAGKPIR